MNYALKYFFPQTLQLNVTHTVIYMHTTHRQNYY